MEIPIEKIKSSPYQPRMEFDLEDIKGSVMKDGIASPIVVREVNEHYELIDGERRVRLARELGFKVVPAQIIEADDEKAMRLVWRLNVERKDYTPKEKAYHFKRCQEQGMSLTGIGNIFGYGVHDILMYLNVFKLPLEYQVAVWAGEIPIGNVRALERLFNGMSRDTLQVTQWLDQRLSSEELRKALNPTLAKFKEAQIEKAQEAVGEIAPEIKLESPEDFKKAAKALTMQAKKITEDLMTAEEKARQEEEKAQKEAEKEVKAEERQVQKEEEERKREEKAEKRVIFRLKQDKTFVKEALENLPKQDREELLDLVPSVQQPKVEKGVDEQVQRFVRDLLSLVSKIDSLSQDSKFSIDYLRPVYADLALAVEALNKLLRRIGK